MGGEKVVFDLLVFSLSWFLSSTKPLSLDSFHLVGGSSLLRSISLGGSHRWSISPRRSISLDSSRRGIALAFSLSIPLVGYLSLFGDLSLCGSTRWRQTLVSVALLKSKGKRVVFARPRLWLFLVWSNVLFVFSVDYVSMWLSSTATDHSLCVSRGIKR